MKWLCRLFLVLFVLNCLFSWNSAIAADYHLSNAADVESFVERLYTMAAVSEAEDDYDLPHREVFVNSLIREDGASVYRVQSEEFQANNGFWYRGGFTVKTRGQTDVPAYMAVTDYEDDAARNQEVAIMKSLFPLIEVLGDPTSYYNCHAYAWCENSDWNERWIDMVDLFANDVHSSRIVSAETAQPGDIVLYYSDSNTIEHSAVIDAISGGEITCISKWGASVLCRHALTYVPATYKKSDGRCATVIIRRTEHAGSCEPTGVNQHTRTCTICGHEETSNCNYTYTYLYDDMHNGRCADCGGTIPGGFCSFTTTSNGDGTHTATCDACNHANTENCQLEYTEISDTHHAMKCRKCEYILSSAPCAFSYTSKGDGTHTKACNVCGQEQVGTAETCTYVYKSNGNNTHSRVCKDCGHLNSGPAVCVFKSDDKCRFCGGVKDSAVINSLEAEFSEE